MRQHLFGHELLQFRIILISRSFRHLDLIGHCCIVFVPAVKKIGATGAAAVAATTGNCSRPAGAAEVAGDRGGPADPPPRSPTVV
jgi:hypothetical protein